MLIGQSDAADIWQAMFDFKQQTGYWLHCHRPEFVWQKDYHDHVIRADEDLAAHVRYIADNPVRRGLVSHWRDYPYTGAIGYDLLTTLQDVATS